MSEQLGEKHSAPAPSPSREQGKQKQQKRAKQTFLSFMPRTKAKDLSTDMDMFNCVDKLLKETNGEPLEPLAHDYKDKIELLESSIKLGFEKMESEEDDNIVHEIAKETDELAAQKGELIEKRRINSKNISDVKNARKHAKEGYDYFKANQKAQTASKFQKIMRDADKLLFKINADAEALKNQEKQVSTVVVLPEVTREEPLSQSQVCGPTAEIEIQEANAAIDEKFKPQERNDKGRKSIEKLKQRRKKESEVEIASDGSLKNAASLPMSVRYKHRQRRGSGLFTKADAFKTIERLEENKNWWLWTPIRLQNGSNISHGVFRCKACSKEIFHLRNIKRHIESDTHTKAKEKKIKAIEMKAGPAKILQERVKKYIDVGVQTTTEEVKRRKAAVRAAAKANISMSALEDLEDTEYVDHSDAPPPSIGNVAHLADTTIPIVHIEDLEILRDILRPYNKEGDDRVKCLAYEHFSVFFDGTPSFAEAEAVMIRVTLTSGDVIDLLIACSLFKKKLNHEHIVNHILKAIEVRIGLDMTLCRAVMCDRASTNKAALTRLKEEYATITDKEGRTLNFLDAWCISHTLSNCGKQFNNKETAPFITLFRKKWQRIIQYKGQARDLARDCMQSEIKSAGGVRFYVHYEQIVQIVDYGLEQIINLILPECIESKWSKESASKLMAKFGTEEKKADLAMAIFEGAVIADTGKNFCEGCYTLEGVSPLIFTAKEVLDRIMTELRTDIPMPRVESVLDRVLELITECEDAITIEMDEMQGRIFEVSQELDLAKNDLRARNEELDAAKGVHVVNGRRRQRNANFLDQDEIRECQKKVKDAKKVVKRIEKKIRKMEEDLEEELEVREKWFSRFPYRTREELMDYAKSLQQKGKSYFMKQFYHESGDSYNMMKIFKGCNTVFNPLWLKENSAHVHDIKTRAKELLPLFGFPEFNDNFIKSFLKEIPRIVNLACNSEFDWDGMEKSERFKTRLEKKKKRMGTEVDDDWKKDAGEKATRIWEFWKPIVKDDSDFPCYSLALRLIVLIQVSSCSVERVFSQMKLVVETCGPVYNDTLEVRMFARCNGDLLPLWIKAYEDN